MLRVFTLMTILIATGCSDPASSEITLSAGEAVITIDNVDYTAEAKVGSRTIIEAEYQQISLVVSDTFYIDILNEHFEEGIVIWTDETFAAEGTRVLMARRGLGGVGFGPSRGYLIITDLSDATISGSFDIDLYNYASSCHDCPENEASVEGQFIAIKD